MHQDRPLSDAETPDNVEVLNAETVFRGYFRVDRYTLRHRMHEGGWTGPMTREIFERGHAVAVLLYDPWADSVVLVEQFRMPALTGGKTAWQIEVVAGIIDAGETPEAVAHRETREEAGETLYDLIPLYHYLVSPGGTSETVRLYCGICDSSRAGGVHGLDEEHEDIKVLVHGFEDAWSMVNDGRIQNAPTIMALQWLALNREDLRARHATGHRG
jgi:ADP-ribose pyrophosphatase